MFKPIRENGLQIEAVLSMGNCIYSVLLGFFSALILYVVTESGIWGNVCADPLGSVPIFLLFIVLGAYYMFDWCDMNRVVYFDNAIGMWQMFKWMVCVVLIGLLALLSVQGNLAIQTIITSLYLPFTISFRDKEFDIPDTDVKNIFATGRKYERYIILSVAIGIAGIISAVYFYRDIPNNPFIRTCFDWSLLLTWCVMLFVKIRRSRKEIGPAYQIIIKQMLGDQKLFSKHLSKQP